MAEDLFVSIHPSKNQPMLTTVSDLQIQFRDGEYPTVWLRDISTGAAQKLAEILRREALVPPVPAPAEDERIERFLRTLVAVKTECGNAMVGGRRLKFSQGVQWMAARIQKVIKENNIPATPSHPAAPCPICPECKGYHCEGCGYPVAKGEIWCQIHKSHPAAPADVREEELLALVKELADDLELYCQDYGYSPPDQPERALIARARAALVRPPASQQEGQKEGRPGT